MLNSLLNGFINNELLHTIVLWLLFSYLIGVTFLPLLVQDILIGAMPDRWSYGIWKKQFWPVVNFVLFIGIFAWILFKLLWYVVKRVIWNMIYPVDYEKYYREIEVPKKYRLPEHLRDKEK